MKPVAAMVAIIVFVLVGPLTGAALAAPDQRTPDAPTGPLTLDLEQLTPRVITADGPTVLTLTGTLTNTGDVPVGEIGIRLQRGNPLPTEGTVRAAIEGGAPTDATAPQFQELPEALAPGERVPIRLTVPLRGSPDAGLALSTTGVYELLVNVNGVPEGGARARLAAVRMLLPVLGLPAGADGSRPVQGADVEATPFSLLYPVVDVPRRLASVPGEPVLLTDDELADSFAPEGRLGGLVAALAEVAPLGSPVRSATCVAVDPDLVQTASAMSAGYQVVTPDGGRVPGLGAEAAARWLTALGAAVRGGCVLALPFADADLVALTRGGLTSAAATAVTDGRAIVADLLDTAVVPNTTWPADGVVDAATLDVLAGAGTGSLLLSADGVDLPPRADPTGVVPLAGADLAVLTDPFLSFAAGGQDGAVDEPAPGVGRAATTTAAGGALSTQDALGALAFRATVAPPDSGPVVFAPPHRWDVGGLAGRALLEGVDRYIDSGLFTPRELDELVFSGPPDAPSVAVEYPLAAGRREISPAIVEIAGTALGDVDDLESSILDDGRGVGLAAVVGPLREGLVRPVSAAWRGRTDLAAITAAAAQRRVDDVRGTVRVLEPPSAISLGTSDAPLLLTVANGLPVTVEVRVELAATSGLRVAPIPTVEIPPLGRRQVQVSAEVLRSGVFTVDAAVRTMDGGRLGPPSRLQVRSTVYGTITVWLTATAGVLLVVLAGRRVLRRIRREPGRHTGPHPRPTPPEPDRTTTTLRPDPAPSSPTDHPRSPPPDPTDPGSAPTIPTPTGWNGPANRPRASAPSPAGPRTGLNPPVPSVRGSGAAVPPGLPVPGGRREPTPGCPPPAGRAPGPPRPHPSRRGPYPAGPPVHRPELPPDRRPESR